MSRFFFFFFFQLTWKLRLTELSFLHWCSVLVLKVHKLKKSLTCLFLKPPVFTYVVLKNFFYSLNIEPFWYKCYQSISFSFSLKILFRAYNFLIKSIPRSLIILRNWERWQTISSIIFVHKFQWTSSEWTSSLWWCPLKCVDEYIVIEEIVYHLSRFLKMIKLLVILFLSFSISFFKS